MARRDDDDRTSRVTRRTLLGGAALLPGLDAWHAAVAGSGIAASGALLSVPGQAIAQVTGCALSFSRDGALRVGPAALDAGDPGRSACGDQRGVGVACERDTCVDMTGDYTCGPAECTNTFVGECNSLGHCRVATGDRVVGPAVRRSDCEVLDGACTGLRRCNEHAGDCDGLRRCDAHDGVWTGARASVDRGAGAHGLTEPPGAERMPYAQALALPQD